MTMGYLAADPETGECVIIDVPLDSPDFFLGKIRENDLSLAGICLTHSHWDHSGDAPLLKRETNADVFIHEADAHRLEDPMKHSLMPLPFDLEPMRDYKTLKHGDVIKCGNLNFEVRHTPGHTEGGICLVEHDRKIVFSGDTLFSGSVGRVDLPGGSGETLIRSIKEQLMNLPDDFEVYSGHGPKTTIGNERRSNPFLTGDVSIN